MYRILFLVLFSLLLIISCTNIPLSNNQINTLTSKESEIIFNPDFLESYYLTISNNEWNLLNENAKNTIEEYVTAELKVGENDIGKVGLRYKGNYSLWNCFNKQGERLCKKLSFKIKINKYDKDKQYYGLKRLNFHSMNTDPSMMEERLAYSIFREMGIITSRAVHTKLFINNEYMGVFTLIEQIDGRFTKNRFPGKGNGNLYKSVWPDSNDPFHYNWGLKTNIDASLPEENNRKICEFYNELSSASNKNEIIDSIEKWWYVDELIKYFVVNDAINNWDGPVAFWCGNWNNSGELKCGNDNFYIYQEKNTDKFHLLAWDLTTVFDLISPMNNAGVPLWYEEPLDCENGGMFLFESSSDNSGKVPNYLGSPNCDLFFQGLAAIKKDENKYKGIYEKYVRELLDGPFKLINLYNKIDIWEKQISDAVRMDEYGPGFDTWESSIQDLKENLIVLEQRLADSLTN